MRRCGTTCAILGALILLATPAYGQLAAGAGKATVAITPAMLPVDGFKTVLDPLAARVLLLKNGDSRVAIAVVDQTSMSEDVVAAVKSIVARETGTPAPAVLVVASHTFSAPHLFTAAHLPPGVTMTAQEQRGAQAYHDAVLAAVDLAARQAAATIQPARAGVGQGISDVNVNRNVAMADGWWLGADPAGSTDKTVDVLRIDGTDGQPLALLVDYAVQSAVMDHSVGSAGKGVTADLAGAAVSEVERQFDSPVVAMFLTGAAGDQIPTYTSRHNVYDRHGHFHTEDRGDAGYALVALQGKRLAEAAVRAGQTASPLGRTAPLRVEAGSVTLDTQERPRDLSQIKPTRSYSFHLAGRKQAPFVVMQIGNVAIIGVQAELSAITGQYIKAHSPFAYTIVVTMVNGAAKYMPEADDYRRTTYEAMNSAYGSGSAEKFAGAIISKLKMMQAPLIP